MDGLKTFFNNSYTLNILKTDKFTTSSISLFFTVPSAQKCTSKMNVLSNALKSGCNRFPSVSSINRRLQEMYGAVFDIYTFKKGSSQVLALYFEFSGGISELQKAVKFICCVLFDPCVKNGVFSEKLTASSKNAAVKNLRTANDDKAFYALSRCEEEISKCSKKNSAFGMCPLGYENEIKEITSSSLYNFYKRTVCSFPCDIYYSGPHDEKKVKEIFLKNFIFPGTQSKISSWENLEFSSDESKSIVKKSDMEQSQLCIGYTFSNADIYSMLLFNEILGGCSDSMLFKNVREEKGLCYSISSKLYINSSAFIIQCGIEKSEFLKTEEAIDKTLSDIMSGSLSDDIVEKAKNSLSQHYLTLSDSMDGLSGFLYACRIMDLNESPESFVKNIDDIPKNKISQTASNVKKRLTFFLEGR
ncbi:MAG: insulinase family protein [Clostridia bacterium]|jgi:predicted Zn-dependent peptidase|nr:insulinase family protein [Clostridia bacterium]MCI2015918.1 insulinase family protein [Clostridia bacterium]